MSNKDISNAQQKTRIALTVDDELNHVLSELSDLTGEPKTKLICDVLNDIVPVYKELVETLKEAKQKRYFACFG